MNWRTERFKVQPFDEDSNSRGNVELQETAGLNRHYFTNSLIFGDNKILTILKMSFLDVGLPEKELKRAAVYYFFTPN